MLEQFLYGFLTGLIMFFSWAGFFGAMLLIWTLAQNDLFFTVLKEGYTKAIMSNGKPVRLVMRSEHHRFARELGDTSGHPWDIVAYEPRSVPHFPPSKTKVAWAQFKKTVRFVSGAYLLDNLVWVGFPPTYKVHAYSFH